MPENQKTKFEWSTKKKIMAVIFIIIIIISVYIFILTILDGTLLFRTIRDYFIVPLDGIDRFWAAVFFLLLMIIQSLIAPIPSELILLSGSMIFGFFWGVILGIVGSLLSAAITYYVSNKGGRSILEASGEKIGIVDRMILIMDEWIESWGIWAIIVGRAVPLIMFDPVSYAAGLSNIKPKQYYVATFIGSIPRAIFYAFLGHQMLDGRPSSDIINMSPEEFDSVAHQFNLIFFLIFGILVMMLILANILSHTKEKKKKNTLNQN